MKIILNGISPNFNFDPQIDNKSALEKEIEKAYQKNKDFFQKEVLNIELIFLYQRSDLNKICKRETKDWEVGHTFLEKNINKIAIFSPNVFDKISDHLSSDFPYVLSHEIAHVFIRENLGFYYPKWLNEGLAGYVAGQYKIRPVKTIDDFNWLHDSENWNKINNYPQAFSFTKYLFDIFGKEKMLKFLSSLYKTIGKHHFPNDFIHYFDEYFGIEFEKIVSDWKNQFQ